MIQATTAVMRKAAREASLLNYNDKKYTPDRPGWTGGKCPRSEYYGKVAEIGAAEFTGYGWQNLCLYSPNREDYIKPDLGEWDVKAGYRFNQHDIEKGVKYILWVEPLKTGLVYKCNVETCGYGTHEQLSGEVLIRGWTHIEEDLPRMKHYGSVYKLPHEAAMRSVDTLPKFDWNQAA